MNIPVLYRKRLIPNECILLKDDILLYRDEHMLITRWNTIRPKKLLHHGISGYFLDRGIKVSKFYNAENELICWYCDIITYSLDESTDTYVFTDLLADVLVYPDGLVKVVDLDELADATASGLITQEQLLIALRQTNALLEMIYNGKFKKLQEMIDTYDLTVSS